MGSIARRDKPGMPGGLAGLSERRERPHAAPPLGQALFGPEFIGTENGSGIGMLIYRTRH